MYEPSAPVQNDTEPEPLLDDSTVGAYLMSRGLISDTRVNVRTLAGGVSNVVLAAEQGARSFVVKQSLARLAVADEWCAPTDRVITEAEALVLLARITPDNVPDVYDQDAERHTITLQLAPHDWTDWKLSLMAGQPQPATAAMLGEILARWHRETFLSPDLGDRLEDYTAFEMLRIEPYYRTVASRAPEVAGPLNSLIDRLAAQRLCLVHGDFSPKNILVAPGSARPGDLHPDGLWVIDFEAAHRGDPAFDIAFMCTHLLLKSLALPGGSDDFDACLRAFCMAYTAHVSDGKAGDTRRLMPLHPDWTYISQHIGALLLSRVKGKSPAGYLDPGSEQTAWRMGIRLLNSTQSTVEDLFRIRNESRS